MKFHINVFLNFHNIVSYSNHLRFCDNLITIGLRVRTGRERHILAIKPVITQEVIK